MFDQLDTRMYDARTDFVRHPNWKRPPYWVAPLLWLCISAGFAFHEWLLVVQDESIAAKEQIAVGSIYKSIHRRGSPDVLYSFSYGGSKYRGSGSSPQDSEAGDYCRVYFDPDDPTTNSLTEYHFQRSIDHKVMTFFVDLSLGLVALLAALLWLWKNSREGDADA